MRDIDYHFSGYPAPLFVAFDYQACDQVAGIVRNGWPDCSGMGGRIAPEYAPLTITVSNGLSSSIYHLTFSLTSNGWNGETYNISLVDIYRDGKVGNLYLARPKMSVPITVSGMVRREIKPGEELEIQTDARKWKLRDGWLPGRYKTMVRVDNLKVDKYSTLSVLSDPIEFEIK